jgi:hypothetical protein
LQPLEASRIRHTTIQVAAAEPSRVGIKARKCGLARRCRRLYSQSGSRNLPLWPAEVVRHPGGGLSIVTGTALSIVTDPAVKVQT